MSTTERGTTDQTATRPGRLKALQIVAPLISLVVLIQAYLAGRGMFVDPDNFDIHGMLGNLTFLLVLAQPVLVYLTGLPGRARSMLLGASVLLLVLVTAQLGLGYGGRESTQAAAWHVPNGVLIFGLSVAIAAYVTMGRGMPDA
jgi:hypothetical protein